MDNNELSALLIPPFRIWLCGTFRVERRAGSTYEVLRTVEWGGSSYPRLLFKALLCCPGRQARREALLDMLWPETDPEQATQNLNTATTKLRRVLQPIKGQQNLLFTDNDSTVYRLSGQQTLWVDVDEALALLKEVEVLGRTSPAALPLLERAADSFNNGPLLQDEEGLWATGRRATTDRKRYLCRLWLVEAYIEQRMPGQAESILNTLLEEDPTDEDVLCRLMTLLMQQGMTHQALRLYEHICKVCSTEGIELADATKSLAAQLRQRAWQAADSSFPLASRMPNTIVHTIQALQMPRNLPEAVSGPRLISTQQAEMEQQLLLPAQLLSADGLEMPLLELQHKLGAALSSPPETIPPVQLSRRETLLTIAALAIPILAAPRKFSAQVQREDVLTACKNGIAACWKLSNEADLLVAYEALSHYLPPLVQLVQNASPQRKTAASLAAQAFLLKAIIGRHVANLYLAELACKEAVTYSQVAEDDLLSVIALRHLAMIYYYGKRHREEIAIYERIKPFLASEEIPPIVRSFILSGLAGTQALYQQPEALGSLELARKSFLDQPATLPPPPFIDFDYSQIFLSEGLAYYDLGEYKQALKAFLQVENAPLTLAERGKLEFLNCQALTILHLSPIERDMQQCLTYWKAGIIGAINLKSRQRFDESCRTYELMQAVWPAEKQVRAVQELTLLWGSEEKLML